MTISSSNALSSTLADINSQLEAKEIRVATYFFFAKGSQSTGDGAEA